MPDDICPWCQEGFEPKDKIMPYANGVLHFECGVRSVVGSVGHQQKTCSCYGGKDNGDPPNVSRRQAARLAMEYYQQHNPEPAT